MTEQKNQIKLSADFIKANSPFKGKVNFAVITYKDPSFLKDYKIVKRIKYSDIPPEFNADEDSSGEFIFAQTKKRQKEFLHIKRSPEFLQRLQNARSRAPGLCT